MLRSRLFLFRTAFVSSAHLFKQAEIDAARRQDVEGFASSFKQKVMTSHPRSTFEYKGSTKGAEVGARNEAAYMNYQEFTPSSLSLRFGMPGIINLLTITPLYCAILALGAVGWGIFYWDQYCQKNYETVLIARPKKLS